MAKRSTQNSWQGSSGPSPHRMSQRQQILIRQAFRKGAARCNLTLEEKACACNCHGALCSCDQNLRSKQNRLIRVSTVSTHLRTALSSLAPLLVAVSQRALPANGKGLSRRDLELKPASQTHDSNFQWLQSLSVKKDPTGTLGGVGKHLSSERRGTCGTSLQSCHPFLRVESECVRQGIQQLQRYPSPRSPCMLPRH